MQIPILIEPTQGGRFRARAGEPFVLTADGNTSQEALHCLELLLKERLRAGAQLAIMNVPNGATASQTQSGLLADDAYKSDWVFQELQDELSENRKLEESANP